MSGQVQEEQDDEDQPQTTAWPVAPVAAVAPGRSGTKDEEENDNEENQAHNGCAIVRAAAVGRSLTGHSVFFAVADKKAERLIVAAVAEAAGASAHG